VPKRTLEVELVGDNDSVSRAMRASVRDSDTLGSRIRHAAGLGAAALGTGLVAGAAAAGYAIKETAEEAEEANKVHAQTAAVLKSTGHAANVSQKDVEGLAGAISRKTGIDDEQIQSGSNLLLTFTNIRNEVGKGNDIFNQATETIVDMSAALGQDTSSSAIQLGKALNDPIKGITALQRVGVSFSEQKAEQIKQWVEEGETLRAQKAILRELGTEFGGSAEAQATAMDKIEVGVGNIKESFGNVFLPLIHEAASRLNRDLVPELQATADGWAEISARKDIDLGEKFKLSGKLIEREWGDVPGQIGHFLDEAIPVVAEHAGDMGVAWAEGMMRGFIHADPLGKAAILLVASKALGGPAAIGGLMGAGKRAGSIYGGAAAAEGAAAMAAGFGLSSRGAKVFGMIEKAKAAGKTIGKAGLAFGVLTGFAAAMDAEEGADAVQNWFHGFTMGITPESKGIGNKLADQLMEQWNDRLPEVRRHIEDGLLSGLKGDRQRLKMTLRLAVETGASEDRVQAIREQLRGLERQIETTENARAGARALRSGQITRLTDIKVVMQRDIEAIRQTTARGSQAARDEMVKNYRAGAHAIEVGIDRGVIKTKTGMEEIRRLTRNAHLVSGDDPWGIAKGFTRTWEKSGTITGRNIDAITRDLGKMPPAAAQLTGQMMIEMARQMRSKGQLSKAEVEKFRSAVVTKLGVMATQGGKKADLFAGNVGGSFGVLNTTVAEALNLTVDDVSKVLEVLGANNPLMNFTLGYAKSHGAGGKGGKYLDQVPPLPGQAQGGAVRVPGSGLQDTVPLAVNGAMAAVVAPGEDLVVLNRHQRPMVDEALAYRWGVNGLPGFFSAYDRPHYMAKGGQLREPRLQGPDPLRSLGQAGIHKGYLAAQDYLEKHRPKPKGGSFKGLGDAPPQLQAAMALAQQMGLTITSTTGGQHAPGSYHYLGRAFDASNGVNTPQERAYAVAAAAKWGSNILELFYDPLGWYIKDGQKIAGAIGDHSDHVHTAMARGGLIRAMARGGSLAENFQDKAQRVWAAAAPLYGASADAAMPRTLVTGRSNEVIPFEDGSRGVRIARWTARDFLRGRDWAEGTLLHEWAHRFQRGLGHLDPTLREGGAEAFERWAAPQVYGSLGLPFSNQPRPNYPKAVAKVIAEKGWDWVKRGQFGRGTGGRIRSFAGGGVVGTIGQVLLNHGFDREAAAGIIGNAYQESRWNPGAMEPGTHNGGLFGFTTEPVSLQNVKDYAAEKGVPWTNAKMQTQFMLHHGEPTGLALRSALNAAGSPEEAARLFMESWERPGVPALGVREDAARRAYGMIGSEKAGSGKKPKRRAHPGRTGKGGGTEGPGGKYPKGSAKSHGESVPGAEASPLPPGASALPEPLQKLLTAPGISYSDRVAVSDIAVQRAEGTEDKSDDRAAYLFQEELFKRNKKRLQKKIGDLRRNLSKRHTAAQDKKWRGELSAAISELGSVEGNLAGVRSSLRGLNEGGAEGEGEGEGGEDPAVKAAEEQQRAAEEQQRAAEELKASVDALRGEIEKQVALGKEEMAIGLAEAKRAMADMIAGELGPRVNRGGLAVGIGTVGSS
jgi:hypothetical protein